MNDKPKGLIPEAPFTLSEFQAIERVLWAYGIYLQKAPASAQNARRLQSLEQIRGRLAALDSCSKPKPLRTAGGSFFGPGIDPMQVDQLPYQENWHKSPNQ